MVKSGTSTGISQVYRNGSLLSSESITQNYRPTRKGSFSLKPFQMTINGKVVVRSNGGTINVGEARANNSVYDDFFGINRSPAANEFIDVKEDAFFAVNVSKNEVFLGEGFNLNVSVYIAERNQAYLEWFEVGEQLTTILKKIKPANCWEENFSIDEIAPEVITINNKKYKQYRIYQANFYPIDTKTIEIPATQFKMIKYKVAANSSFFGRQQIRDFVSFSSKPKTIKIKELPPHPLRDKVSVGNFRLDETITNKDLRTGESFTYDFRISGEGNISAIREPMRTDDNNFDFYSPSMRQQVTRSDGTVYGTKAFSYMAVPKEPGEFKLSNYLQWVFFNPKTAQYDTLIPNLVVQVTGESKANADIESNNAGGFYELMNEDDHSAKNMNQHAILKNMANILIITILVGLIALVMIPKQKR